MAIVSKFVRDSATVDLNDTTNGFSLSGQGWLPVVATPVYKGDPAPVVETLNLLLTDTTQDAISADMQALHAMQVWADAYINDPTVEHPVWLHAKMDNETGERRAVVYSIEVQYGASWYGDEATSIDIPVTVSVTRGPYWESTTARDLPQDTGAVSTGVVYVYNYTASGASVDAHDIVGDVGARVRIFDIDPTTDQQRIHYMGLRSADKHGATGITNFVPVWEFEAGANASSDVTDTTGALSSASAHITISESVLDWDDGSFHLVSTMHLDDFDAGNPGDQAGEYLWLMRAKKETAVSAVWEVQIRYGNDTLFDDSFAIGRTVEVSANTWSIYEMGIRKVPNSSIKALSVDDIPLTRSIDFVIKIYARRTSGTGDLELDCILPFPVDEGYLKLTRGDHDTSNAVFGQSPHGISDSIAANVYREKNTIEVSIDNFVLPVGDGRIYFITLAGAAGTTQHLLTSVATLNTADIGKYYERWLSLRGTE